MSDRGRGGWFGEQFEYVVLVVLVLAVGGGVAAWLATREEDPPPSRAGQRPASRDVPTCEAAGITPLSTREGTCRTKTSVLTIVNQGSELALDDVRLEVLRRAAIPATTPRGRARRRVRVRLDLRLENDSRRTLRLRDTIYLAVAGGRVRPDTAADEAPGAIRVAEPILPNSTARGTVRFELAGAQGAEILRRGRAELGVRPGPEGAGPERVGVVRLRLTRVRPGDG